MASPHSTLHVQSFTQTSAELRQRRAQDPPHLSAVDRSSGPAVSVPSHLSALPRAWRARRPRRARVTRARRRGWRRPSVRAAPPRAHRPRASRCLPRHLRARRATEARRAPHRGSSACPTAAAPRPAPRCRRRWWMAPAMRLRPPASPAVAGSRLQGHVQPASNTAVSTTSYRCLILM
eukprot:SAG11_NODE_943_length_6434_cov_3.493133_4_plen_178_part_00